MNNFGDFGGATQFAGGGFMTDAGNTGMPESKDLSGMTAPETMRSLTVAQLTRAQTAAPPGASDVYVDNRPVRNVTMVGQLQWKHAGASSVESAIYDGTGTIICVSFADSDPNETPMSNITEGTYVRVYGSFRGEVSDKPGALGPISLFQARAVADHNEVIHHNLSVIFEHMYLTQSQNIGAGGNMAAPGVMPGLGAPMQMPNMQGGMPGNMANAMQPQGHQQGVGGGMDVEQLSKQIQSYVRDTQQEGVGVSDATIQQHFQAQFSPATVSAAIGKLLHEGHMYRPMEGHVVAI